MVDKIYKLAERINDQKYKISLISIAKKLTSNDTIIVSKDELIKLIDPERVKYDAENSIGDVAVDSKSF